MNLVRNLKKIKKLCCQIFSTQPCWLSEPKMCDSKLCIILSRTWIVSCALTLYFKIVAFFSNFYSFDRFFFSKLNVQCTPYDKYLLIALIFNKTKKKINNKKVCENQLYFSLRYLYILIVYFIRDLLIRATMIIYVYIFQRTIRIIIYMHMYLYPTSPSVTWHNRNIL